MTKKYDVRSFNNLDYYTINEIADKLSVNSKTVRKWELEGLKMDKVKRPIYIHGKDIKDFLKLKNQKRRCNLGSKEFYCCKCHKPVEIEKDSFTYKITEKILNKKGHRQIIIQGKCQICGTVVSRFSSEQKIEELKRLFTT